MNEEDIIRSLAHSMQMTVRFWLKSGMSDETRKVCEEYENIFRGIYVKPFRQKLWVVSRYSAQVLLWGDKMFGGN
tara:strand:+ start:849 stop:1073 length:225 start_codon:yes stop_codon:yes gene_type:complete